ncbi:MAG: DUF1801 domain-containing protein [Dehalococcoidia bacterium]
MNTKPTDINDYLSAVPDDARAALEELRRTIKAAAPDAVESISYGMPTFKYRGRPLIYFAAAKAHCALYGTSRGTIRFPAAEPPSESLVRALVNERIANIEAKATGRKK